MKRSLQQVNIAVTSDLVSDQRVLKIATSLKLRGYDVKLIGRKLKLKDKKPLKDFRVKRFKLVFNNGFLFYAEFNLRLFFYLLFSQKAIIYANDLDTLPACFLVSRLKSLSLVYDSHEYFTEVPELINRPGVKAFWEFVEKSMVSRLKNCITVSGSIAKVYEEKYRVKFHLVRNFPVSEHRKVEQEKENVVIYQGALNVGRGLEEIIAAMPFINSDLWLAGAGDVEDELKKKVKELKLQHKVKFLGRLNAQKLKEYTERARLGLSIEKTMGLNYTYALPNKVFDYLHAGTPVLYAGLIEVKQVLKGFNVGEELTSYQPKALATQVNNMLVSQQYSVWQEECRKAAACFNWQKEEQVLLSIFEKIS